MSKPIIELTRGVPKTDREWMALFRKLTQFIQYSGNTLIINGDFEFPPGSVGTDELEDNAVTNAKIRDSVGTSVIGRAAASTGNPDDIVAGLDGAFLSRQGGILVFATIADSDIPTTIARTSQAYPSQLGYAGI